MQQACNVPIGREHSRSLLTDAVNGIEDPLTMAEGAAAALSIMADALGRTSTASALAFLSYAIERHLAEVRDHWTRAHNAVHGGGNG